MIKRIPLGTLILGERVGAGGYGEVFKARLEPLDRDFAVKLLNPSPFHSDAVKVRNRFIKEGEFLMSLRHDYITPIYLLGEFSGQPYILMEYFEGRNLYQAREVVGVPPPFLVLGFVEYAALGLAHAHRNKIVHRDIKPSNLLTRRGDARVVDFGIAQIMDPDGLRFTQTGGTPVGDAYAAPELIDNPRMVDPRCDIYSLGACWFWLLTGTTPRGRNWESALRGIEQMTPGYERVILKTLDQVEKRYQTMEELAKDIQALRTGVSPDPLKGDELDDNATLLLGIIFEQCVPEAEPTTVYRLEQELSGTLTRFALGISLAMLRRLEYITSVVIEREWNNEIGYNITDTGEGLVAANRNRIEGLLSGLRSPKPSEPMVLDPDEIPF